MAAIVSGAGVTIMIWIFGTIAAAILGFLIAVARRYGGMLVDKAFGLVVAVLRARRSHPDILVYYGGLYRPLARPLPAGLLGISIYGAAYYSEIFRAGFDAVPKGISRRRMRGLNQWQIVRRILLPEMDDARPAALAEHDDHSDEGDGSAFHHHRARIDDNTQRHRIAAICLRGGAVVLALFIGPCRGHGLLVILPKRNSPDSGFSTHEHPGNRSQESGQEVWGQHGAAWHRSRYPGGPGFLPDRPIRSGKSTLLRCMAFLEEARAGRSL